MQLLLAETFEQHHGPEGSASPTVHEVHFARPVRVAAFRIVARGEMPHPELNFQGHTPAAPLSLELFGAQCGKGSLCATLLPTPHLRDEATGSPSALELLPGEGLLCDYLVIR